MNHVRLMFALLLIPTIVLLVIVSGSINQFTDNHSLNNTKFISQSYIRNNTSSLIQDEIHLNYGDAIATIFDKLSFPAIIALISFWYIYLRGPSIVCSPLNWILIGHSGLSIIISDFVFSNSGTSTGVINSVFINLKCISRHSSNQRFFPFKEDFDLDKLVGGHNFSSIDNPFRPFMVEKSMGIIKQNFLFSSEDENYRFYNGEYIIEIYVLLAGKKKPIKVLEQKLLIREDLAEYGTPKNARKGMIYNPLEGVLSV
jgi:hypothetical protein